MIANAGKDERGKYTGGKAGDQGREFAVIKWYNRPWSCVLRFPDMGAAVDLASIARTAAQNNNIGYDQSQRMTFYDKLRKAAWDPSKISEPCEGDCSSITSGLIQAVGHRLGIKELQKVNPALTTSVMRKALMSAGFDCLTDKKYLTSDEYLMPGDVLLYDGHHTAINLDVGSKVGATDDITTRLAWDVIRGKAGTGWDARRAYIVERGGNPAMVRQKVNDLKRQGAF